MFRRSLLAAPLVLAATSGRAQSWVPKQPIKILVGYAPGGTADMAARIAAETIHRQHGYTVALVNEVQTQRFNKGALAHPWHTADAKAKRIACVGQ